MNHFSYNIAKRDNKFCLLFETVRNSAVVESEQIACCATEREALAAKHIHTATRILARQKTASFTIKS
jgi:hypothetical protein